MDLYGDRSWRSEREAQDEFYKFSTWLQGPVNHLPEQSFDDTHVLVVKGFLSIPQIFSSAPGQWTFRVWEPVPHSSEH